MRIACFAQLHSPQVQEVAWYTRGVHAIVYGWGVLDAALANIAVRFFKTRDWLVHHDNSFA